MTGNGDCPKEEIRLQKAGIINIGPINTGVLEEGCFTNFPNDVSYDSLTKSLYINKYNHIALLGLLL
jgi:hypothetical protein